MEIVLIRHGEPEWVRDGLAVVDPPLTERGHRQAERLARWLHDERFDEVLVSPLVRARQTAGPLLEALGSHEVIDPWLEEIRDPMWHGSPAEKAAEAYAELKGRPAEDRWHGLEGGESIRDFVARIRAGASTFLADRGVVRAEAASHRTVVVYGVRAPDDFQSLAVRYSFVVESPGGGGFAGLAVHCGRDDPTPIFAVIRSGKHSVSIGLSRSGKASHGWDVAASIRSPEGTSTKSADWVEVFGQAQQLLAKLMCLPDS